MAQHDRRVRRRSTLLLVAAALALTLGACGPQPKPRSYEDQARLQYQKAKSYFDDENYLEAIKAFNIVRNRHPYSGYATLAELRIADSNYEMNKYVEAAAGYRSFVRFHPHHKERPFALFRVGVCYYEQIPGYWWFMPPAHERELGSTQDALRELQSFTTTYPKDERVPKANEMILDLRRRLAAHELYVARFYARVGKPRGAVKRANYLLKKYSDVGLTGEALLVKGQAHLALDEKEAARAAFQQLVKDHATSKEGAKARETLQTLGAAPEAPVAPSPAPAAAPTAAPANPS